MSGKESACRGKKLRRQGFNPWVGKNRNRQPTPVFLPAKYSLVESCIFTLKSLTPQL